MLARRGYPAHAISYRGHPPNPALRDLGKVSIGDYVADAAGVARTLDRPILIGHSLGGLVAQILAERDVCRAAILVSPAPPRGITVFTIELFLRTLKQLPALLLSRPLIPNARDMDALVLNCVPIVEREAIFARFSADSGRAARQAAIGVYRVRAESMRCPILVVAGSEDRFIPARIAAKVARKYGAALRIVPNRGHDFFAEPGWEAEFSRLIDWIDALPAENLEGSRGIPSSSSPSGT